MQITPHTEYSTTSVHEITNTASVSFVFSDHGNETSVLPSSLTGDSLPNIDAIGLSSSASDELSLLPLDSKLSPETSSEQLNESEALIHEETWPGLEKMSNTTTREIYEGIIITHRWNVSYFNYRKFFNLSHLEIRFINGR